MNELDACVGTILSDMAVLPDEVRGAVMERMAEIGRAIDEDMMETGTTIIEFTDLSNHQVVLSLTIGAKRSHLDFSTAEEAMVVSNGYDFVDDGRGVEIHVDREARDGLVDHGSLMLEHKATTRRLADIESARDAVRRLPGFGGDSKVVTGGPRS